MSWPDGVLWAIGMPCAADPSRPADVLMFGEMLVEVILVVYAAETAELATERGEVFRCMFPTGCGMPTGT